MHSTFAKTPDAKAKYDALKALGETQRLKKEFRTNWAKDNLEANTEVRHRQEESWSRVHGVYMSFEKIVQEEGGETSPAAVKAATLYAMNALVMGGEWIRNNVMTERTDILYLQYSRDSTFTRNWSPHLDAKGDGAPPATEESEPGETNAKAACETPVLPVQIKESKQQPTASGASKRAREGTTPAPKAKNNVLRPLTSSGPQTLCRNQQCRSEHVCKPLCRAEPT